MVCGLFVSLRHGSPALLLLQVLRERRVEVGNLILEVIEQSPVGLAGVPCKMLPQILCDCRVDSTFRRAVKDLVDKSFRLCAA